MNVWEISVPPSQFSLKSKTTSKEKKKRSKRERERTQRTVHQKVNFTI